MQTDTSQVDLGTVVVEDVVQHQQDVHAWEMILQLPLPSPLRQLELLEMLVGKPAFVTIDADMVVVVVAAVAAVDIVVVVVVDRAVDVAPLVAIALFQQQLSGFFAVKMLVANDRQHDGAWMVAVLFGAPLLSLLPNTDMAAAQRHMLVAAGDVEAVRVRMLQVLDMDLQFARHIADQQQG